MNLYSDSDILLDNLRVLVGKDDTVRAQAAIDIKAHVECAARELSLVRFAAFENELYRSIFGHVLKSEGMGEKLGGILAIRELIDCTSAAAEEKVIKFAETLAHALYDNTDYALIELVAVALGHMARNSPVSHVDYVESELIRALEWLKSTQSHRRFAACAVLQQLAENAPTIFFVRTKEFFDLIWGPLWDSKEKIRQAAGRALSACLAVLRQRTYHLQWYCCIYEQIHEGFRKGTAESVHGSLLVVSEMLKHTGDFMVPRFKEVCRAIMALQDHRSRVVRGAIASLIPALAQFCPDAFARMHLDESVDVLVKCARSAELRQQALLSTGQLCQAVGAHLVPRVDELLQIVKEALVGGARKNRLEVASEALQCVSDMVQGLGAPFHDRVLSLLEPMLQSGLTAELIDTLAVVATYMPNQRPAVQQRLLEEAVKVLGGHAKPKQSTPHYVYSWARKGTRGPSSISPYANIAGRLQREGSSSAFGEMALDFLQPTASSSNLGSSSSANLANLNASASSGGGSTASTSLSSTLKSFGKSLFRSNKATLSPGGALGMGMAGLGLGVSMGSTTASSSGVGANAANTVMIANSANSELVLLSLRTLGSLSHPPSSLMVLVQQSVLPYLSSPDPRVRKESAMTCAKMIASAAKPIKTTGPTAAVTEAIVARLLEVIVSDPNPSVRLATLRCLHAEFDKYLSRSHHIDSLMFILSDENFETKIEALMILGRQATTNPSAVLPPLRLVFMRLISEIKNSSDNRLKEEATLMMCTFLRAAPLQRIVRPFMSTVIRILPLRGDVRLTTAGLEAIGELSVVLRQEMLPFADQLLPVIIHNVHDSSSRKKQEMAIRTLGHLVSATGQVVKPYLQYPQLLPRALDTLFKHGANMPWSLRREVLRTLGLLGALEPHKYNLIVSHLALCEANIKADAPEGIERLSGEGWRGHQQGASPGYSGRAEFLASSPDRSGQTRARHAGRRERGDSRDVERTESHLADDRETHHAREGFELIEDLIQSEVLLDDDNAERPAHLFMYEQSVMRSLVEPAIPTDVNRRTPSNDDYYPRVAITALMHILRDSSQSVHHSSVAQAIMVTFKSLGMHCVPFLEEIVPYLLQLLRKCGPGLRESLLQQLSELAQIVQYHLAPYLPALFEIIKDFWSQHLEHILALVENIAKTTLDAFGSYVTVVVPLLLSSLVVPPEVTESALKAAYANSSSHQAAIATVELAMKPLEKTLSCHDVLRSKLQPHIHLAVPAVCKLITQLQELGVHSIKWQTMAIKVVRRLCTGYRGAVLEQSNVVMSRVVHTLARATTSAYANGVPSSSELYEECINTLCALGRQMGSRLGVFDGLILSSIEGRGLNTTSYRELSAQLHSGTLMEFSFADREEFSGMHGGDLSGIGKKESESDLLGISHSKAFATAQSKLPVNQQQLARAWDVSQRSTAADWNEWLKRLKVDLLRESPSAALRACSALAQAHAPMAQELFHAAFVSCWHELAEQYQDSLVKALQTAFRSNTIPPEILQTLLNLAEFMEHDVEALPISLNILAELAQKSHAYAKALHYRELEFQTSPGSCFESLININKKLDQYDAAMGVIKVVAQMQEKHPELADAYKVQEAWLAKLGHWNEALEKYKQRLDANPRDSLAIAGKLKCLESLGRWEEAIQMCTETLDHLRLESAAAGDVTHIKAAVIGARAAWSLNEWDLMDTFVSQLPPNNIDSCFMRAVLAVHNGNYEGSAAWIDKTRTLLDSSIAALLTESYGRAYVPLILVQQCAELEEITEYNMLLRECTPKVTDGHDSEGGASFAPTMLPPSSITRALGRNGSHPSIPSSPGRNQGTMGSHNSFLNNEGNEGSNSALQLLQLECHRRKQLLAEKWRRRIRGCASSGKAAIPVWKYLLNGRRMVLNEKEDLDTWLEFATLCRKGGNHDLAERVLQMSHNALTSTASAGPSQQSSDEVSMEYRIRFAMLKQKWAVGSQVQALAGLDSLIRSLGKDPSKGTDTITHHDCLLRLGEWKIALVGPGQPVDANTRRDVLALYSRATLVLPTSYKAWHQWGLSNYRAIEEARGKGVIMSAQQHSPLSRTATFGALRMDGRVSRQIIPSLNNVPIEVVAPLAVNTVKGLMRAIALGTRRDSSSVMEDMLCVLSTWFKYGRIPDVCAALEASLSTVHLDNWLGVLPQLIARIDHPEPTARRLLHGLLTRLGAKHSQALVYPLSVALKSPKEDRKEAAEGLMASLRLHSAKLIDQALMVSHELVRMAILWQEEWHESLEEASKQYFGDGNIQAMLDTLAPLHQMVEGGPTTLKEMSFCQAYAHDLNDAWESIKNYRRVMADNNTPIPVAGAAPTKKSSGRAPATGGGADDAYLHQAWDLYYSVFKRINAQLPQLMSLELQYCSPSLLAARDLDLGVPGTYTVSGHTVRISRFSPTVAIIRSKQRPRRLRIFGEDGSEFVFLLKGHEDLRQDERAMQLFGLVNALLLNDGRTGSESHDLSIQRYAVLPLSPTAGLISWVPNCDTLHDLIRDYRESKKIMLNVEHKLMQQMAPNQTFDSLPQVNKLEVFEWALANTNGEDLAKILWLKSETSEAWLHRRACYTRSLAVMSMVGYILGLGDRHPSNLMLDRQSGKVLHIDFGDCFEVAMQRDKFPEKVPFRLTRMLVNAMEVSGIEGNYRLTCEKVMAVLRENRDSLVATLEAFVHDPLITWRLLHTGEKKKGRKGPEGRTAVSATNAAAPAASTTTTPDKKLAEAVQPPSRGSNHAQVDELDISHHGESAIKHDGVSGSSTVGTCDVSLAAKAEMSNTNSGVSSAAPTAAGALSSPSVMQPLVNPDQLEDSPPSAAVLRPVTPPDGNAYPSIFAGSSRSRSHSTRKAQLEPVLETDTGEGVAVLTALSLTHIGNLSDKLDGEETASKSNMMLQRPSDSLSVSPLTPHTPLELPNVPVRGDSTKSDVSKDRSSSEPSAEGSLSSSPPPPPPLTKPPQQQLALSSPLSTAGMDSVAANKTTLATIPEPQPNVEYVFAPATTSTHRIKDMHNAERRTLNLAATGVLFDVAPTAYQSDDIDAHPNIGTTNASENEKSQTPAGSDSKRVGDRAPSGSHVTPNLHLEMSSLVNSLHSPGRRSFSYSRRSVKDITRAQAAGGAEAALRESTQAVDTALDQQEELTEKAVAVIRRVMDKLTGLDFNAENNGVVDRQAVLDVHEQVDRLIRQATASENLCLSYFGWCPFW